MRTVNIHEAKTHLSRLVQEASEGQEIVIARAGRPVARLVPLSPLREPRPIGLFDGEAWELAPDFDELPPDMAEALGVAEP